MRKPAGTPPGDTVLVRGCEREETYVCGGGCAPLVLREQPTVASSALLLCNNCGSHNAPEERQS